MALQKINLAVIICFTERFQIYETPSRMTIKSSNVHGCYEDKSQQTDKVSSIQRAGDDIPKYLK